MLNESYPRGIKPALLISQIRNTAPFLFDVKTQPVLLDGATGDGTKKSPRDYLRRILRADAENCSSHFDYFELCLSAHHATVATFVPTDVDLQIRIKLWHPQLTPELAERMTELVLESLHWDWSPVSRRSVTTADGTQCLDGHQGEWFSTAAAAYGHLRRRRPELAARVARAIIAEVEREACVIQTISQSGDGIATLKAATQIAHNLGDLDRVIDQWNLLPDDPLRAAVYKSGHEGDQRFRGLLVRAGELNKRYMAVENHRHFTLRGPRCLRRNADFLIGIGPFFDDWGATLGRHPELPPRELAEIIEALVDGHEKLNDGGAAPAGPVGYARALSGMLDHLRGGLSSVASYLPARIERTLRSGLLRTRISVPKHRFEEQWASYGRSRTESISRSLTVVQKTFSAKDFLPSA